MLIKSKVFPFLSNHPSNLLSFRTFINNLELKFVADRGLDHAVEKEKDLKGVINLKNLLKSEPSKSLSLSSIVDNVQNLGIPCRVIDFIRKYPSIFEEYFPANIAIHPHVRLTPESLNLDAEEQLIYGSDLFKNNAADRLLKLLMLCRFNELPFKFIDLFKWDLGFPDNYADSLVPEFPHYFRVKNVDKGFVNRSNKVEGLLELVCWSDELAVSDMEKRAMKEAAEYRKGMPIAFPLQFSSGFVMDKGLKRWVDEWQRLPYVSPYEHAVHFEPNSNMFDKCLVAVLHELLHIFVTKKTERDNLLIFGEYLGVKSSVKRALTHHPGIFYRSSKIGTHTMVLREGYKRGLLIDKHPLIDLRNKYIHLMHKVMEVQKVNSVTSSSASKQQVVKEGVTEKGEDNANECEEAKPLSDVDGDENCNNVDDEDDDEEEEEEVRSSRAGRRFERRGSHERVTEGPRKQGESRGRPRKHGGNDNEKWIEGSRGGRQNGSRGFGKVFEGKRNRGEGSGTPRKNVSWDLRGGDNADERVKSSRDGQRNVRRGSGKVYDDIRKSGEGKGRPRRNSSRGESGDHDHKKRIESSRDAHKYGSRGSGKLHEGRKAPGEGNKRPRRNGSQERSTKQFSART